MTGLEKELLISLVKYIKRDCDSCAIIRDMSDSNSRYVKATIEAERQELYNNICYYLVSLYPSCNDTTISREAVEKYLKNSVGINKNVDTFKDDKLLLDPQVLIKCIETFESGINILASVIEEY